jgi:hypothetical protein
MLPQYRGSLCAITRGLTLSVIAAAWLVARTASAEEKEPVAVLELSGAGAWTVPGGSSFGPTAAVEFEPIKNYLVIETGITPVIRIGISTSCSVDCLICPRQWSLSPA